MTLEDFLPEDTKRCMRTLSLYWQEDINNFLIEYRSLKRGIVGSLDMYSGFPAWTNQDTIFRSVMNSLDRVLSVLDNEVWELFPHYFHPITDELLIWDRIVNIDERLRKKYGKLGVSHRIGWGYSLACRVEKYTRYKDIDATLYRSPGTMQIIHATVWSLAAMGIK